MKIFGALMMCVRKLLRMCGADREAGIEINQHKNFIR